MMTLLHSVWSGSGSAAGRRRSLLALGALLALVASVLIWASPSQAQNESPPVAVAVLGDSTTSGTPPVTTQVLDGSGSFDPDATNNTMTYQWEVLTEAYSWVALSDAKTNQASFTVPSPTLAARYGNTIEFKLTVNDGDSPPATDSTTLTYNINQGPTADIAVSAMLADPANPDVAGYDDNGNGVKDENAERFPLDGVIDGPGENGNADNEWDIAEGALITLDGSGSSDPGGRLATNGHDWERVYITTVISPYDSDPTGSLPGDTENAKKISTDDCPNTPRQDTNDSDTTCDETAAETMTLLKSAANSGKKAPNFYVYYKLTVNDGATGTGGATNSAVVKLVVHDQPANPRVATLVPSVTDATDGVSKLSAEVVPPKSGKYVIAPGSKITVTATASDADGDTPTVSWEGAQATAPGALTANFVAPATAEEGDEFTITATATDITGRTGTKSVVLVVATNTQPEAVAPGALATTQLYSSITVNDGPDGGDVNPATGKGTGTVKLRGIGFDADGDAMIFNWTELAMARNAEGNVVMPSFETSNASNCPGGSFNADLNRDGTDDACAINTPSQIKLPLMARVSIDNAFSEDGASFAVPEVTGKDKLVDHDNNTETPQVLAVPIAFTVIDKWSVSATKIVIVFINNNDDPPVANAGPDQQVTSGSFVRLNGAGSSDSDPGDKIKHAWTYTGISTDPATDKREPITAAERGYGYVEGTWFPYDGVGYVCANDGANTPDDADDKADMVQVFSNHSLGAPVTDSVPTECGTTPYYNTTSPSVGSNNVDYNHDDDNNTADIKSYPVDFRVLAAGTRTSVDSGSTDQYSWQRDAPSGYYHPTAGGMLKGGTTAYPYLDAPKIGVFDSVKLTFSLVVTDGQNTTGASDPTPTDDDASKADSVTITITDGYYTGQVTGPDFCLARSLGGPQTYPYDSDNDGVADICSLNTTRRATVARQNALETLAALNPNEFKDALHGKADGSTDGTCASAPKNLGDSDAELAADSCGPAAAAKRAVSSPPPAIDPAKADVFFSGAVTGPTHCANMSLGGPTTYAFDSDGDGVADVCSLPFTRREAVARQNALNAAFSGHAQYKAALAAACTDLGSTDFGDSPSDLAKDECDRPPAASTGTPLPTSS